ncbi:MAG TPA: hypothetical protein VLV78_19080 [Thermoanaerobaculia bacterium]|nr:hypothetical protein [Thermoanaerobaculia bacterium]
MAEWFLNVAWSGIAIFAFAVLLPKVDARRRVVGALVLAGVLVLLFPIISISDDLNADSAAQEVLAVIFTVVGLIVVLGTALRLTPIAPQRLTVAAVESFDPRSPPRG